MRYQKKFKQSIVKCVAHIKEKWHEPHNLFLLVAIPAIVAFINITPISWGLDEQVHIARAYQITDGNLYPDFLGGHNYGGEVPKSLDEVLRNGWKTGRAVNVTVPYYSVERIDIYDSEIKNHLGSESINDPERITLGFGTTGAYSPVVYAPAAAGIGLGRILNLSVRDSIEISKYFQALIYILLAYGSIRLISKQKVVWLVFVWALLPTALFQAATINADVYSNAISLLFIAIIIHAFTLKGVLTKNAQFLISIVSIGLMFAKPSYVLALPLIWLIPNKTLGTRRGALLKKTVLTSVAAIVFGVITYRSMAYADANMLAFSYAEAANMGLRGQLEFILSHPTNFMRSIYHTVVDFSFAWQNEMIGKFGYNAVAIPHFAITFWVMVVTAALLYMGRIKPIHSIGLIAAGFLSGFAVVTILYLTFNQIGTETIAGVQGRYFIPSTLLVAIGVGGLLPMKLEMGLKIAKIFFTTATAIILGIAIYVYMKALY